MERKKIWCLTDSLEAARSRCDMLRPDYGAELRFDGVLKATLQFTREKQLCSPERWHHFMEQFRMDADGSTRGWRGEYWGKMMRGACFVYASCPDEKLEAILRTTVEEMMGAADETGRISSYGVSSEYHGWDMWCRKYVMLGMEYYWEICPDEAFKSRIVTSLRGQADAILAHIGPREAGKIPVTEATGAWKGLNSVSILEPMVRLYHLTGEQKYFDFATYLVSTGGCGAGNLFEMAAEDALYPYQYPVTKAYEMMSCFEGLLEYARLTQNQKWMDAVVKFAHKIIESDITVIGSSGCTHELFDHSKFRQTTTDYDGVMQETCVTVTWMKFCTQVLYLTGDPLFADQIEQSMYNAYIGATNTEGRLSNSNYVLSKMKNEAGQIIYPDLKAEILPFDSYSPLVPGIRGKKVGGLQVMSDQTYYGCCACIASAGIGLVSRMMIDRSDKGIYWNLYENGTVRTVAGDGSPIEMTLTTAYPADGRLTFSVKGQSREAFGLYLRIPGWSAVTAVTVDGRQLDAVPGRYLRVLEHFDGEHRIEVQFDMRVFAIHPFGVGFGKDVLRNEVNWREGMCIPAEYTEDPHSRFHVALRRGPLMLGVDQRLGRSVDLPVTPVEGVDGTVEAEMLSRDAIPYPCLVACAIRQKDGSTFAVTDYSSVGKTWDEESRCGVWMPIPETLA